MSTCEACLIACSACVAELRRGGLSAAGPMLDAVTCVQACELALHAMNGDAMIAPAACSACARTCEALARDCMLLNQPEYRRCAQACYRAARECRRIAESRGTRHALVRAAGGSAAEIRQRAVA